jgi:hypothetical protein
LSDMLSG